MWKLEIVEIGNWNFEELLKVEFKKKKWTGELELEKKCLRNEIS